MARLCDNCGAHGADADILLVDLDLPLDPAIRANDLDLCAVCRYAVATKDWLGLHRRQALITIFRDAANPE